MGYVAFHPHFLLCSPLLVFCLILFVFIVGRDSKFFGSWSDSPRGKNLPHFKILQEDGRTLPTAFMKFSLCEAWQKMAKEVLCHGGVAPFCFKCRWNPEVFQELPI